MTFARERLAEGARTILGRALSEREAEGFEKYLNLLIKWQKVQRLVGSSEPAWIVDNLLLDSLLFLKVLPLPLVSLLDLGAGAGLPGIPLKIVMPEIELTLVEARQRRASFLSSAVRELRLARTRVMNVRIEEVSGELASMFDAVVMRCAGDVATLFPLAIPLVRPGGSVVASGPPRPAPLSGAEWVTVPGVRPSRDRRFAVHRRP